MTDTKHSAELATCDFCRAVVPVQRKYLYRENKEREIGDGFTITRYCRECGLEGKPDTNHTDSVGAMIEEVAQTIKIIACKAGSHGRTWKEADKMIRYELSKLVQAQTSQQVEEAVRKMKARLYDVCETNAFLLNEEVEDMVVYLEDIPRIVELALTPNHQD